MFGFNSKIEKLEKRIADLEDPFIFDIGDKVWVWIPHEQKHRQGIVNERSYIYEDWRFSRGLTRENTYFVFHNGITHKVNEMHLSKSKPKKYK